MVTKATQNERVLNLLINYNHVSQLFTARLSYPILRLGARMYDLRRQGHKIDLVRIHRGKRSYWAYRLVP